MDGIPQHVTLVWASFIQHNVFIRGVSTPFLFTAGDSQCGESTFCLAIYHVMDNGLFLPVGHYDECHCEHARMSLYVDMFLILLGI